MGKKIETHRFCPRYGLFQNWKIMIIPEGDNF